MWRTVRVGKAISELANGTVTLMRAMGWVDICRPLKRMMKAQTPVHINQASAYHYCHALRRSLLSSLSTEGGTCIPAYGTLAFELPSCSSLRTDCTYSKYLPGTSLTKCCLPFHCHVTTRRHGRPGRSPPVGSSKRHCGEGKSKVNESTVSFIAQQQIHDHACETCVVHQ